MANQTHTHWKKLTNPDYLGAWSITDGQDLIATIKSVGRETVTGADGKKDECTVIHFEEPDIKPMICNSTNAKTISKVIGSPYIEDWAGHDIQIGTEQVKAFGDIVDALRVRPHAPVQTTNICEECGGAITPPPGKTLRWWVQYSQGKCGKALCGACWAKHNKK